MSDNTGLYLIAAAQLIEKHEKRISALEWEYASVVNQFHDALKHNTKLEEEVAELKAALQGRNPDWSLIPSEPFTQP